MRYIINYNNFNESKGISYSCENILYKIWNIIEDNVSNFKSSTLKFDIDEPDFKCKDVILNYNIFINQKENICNVQSNFKETSMNNYYLINSTINIDILIKNLDDEFTYYIKSVLFHELLHIFQHYNILKGNKFRPESFSIGSILPSLRKIIKTKYGSYILDILYYSLSNELSAQIHLYYLYKMNNKEYKRLYDIRNLLLNFKIIELNEEQEKDIKIVKLHITNSIKFGLNYKKNSEVNLNYLKSIDKSIWNENDLQLFLIKLKKVIDKKIKWIDKKIKLIDKKIEENKIIKYNEDITLPHDWEMYDIFERYNFIKENLNDCSLINNI